MNAVPPPPASATPQAPAWDVQAGYAGPSGSTGGPEQAPGGVASLVFGIVGVTVLPFIGSVVALVFGYQSRRAARAEPGRYNDQLGQIGRILGWVGVALGIVAIALVALALFFFVAVGVSFPA